MGKDYYTVPLAIVLKTNLYGLLSGIIILSALGLYILFTKEINSWGIGILFIWIAFLLSIIVAILAAKKSAPILENWILDNVRCPKCNGTIKKCSCTMSYLPPTRCIVQCKKCNRNFLLVNRLVAILTVDREVSKKDSEKSIEEIW